MALRSIEIASDGLLASGNSLSIAVQGLLRTSAITVVRFVLGGITGFWTGRRRR